MRRKTASPLRWLVATLLALTAAGVSGGVQAADPAAGRQKAQMCAACHGIDGVPKVPDAPMIAGESTFYLSRQLKAFRSGERRHEQMSIIAEALSDEDIADLAAWYSSIKVSVEVPGQ